MSVSQESNTVIKGTLYSDRLINRFSNDFPLSVEQILPVLELLSPTGKHFQKMKTFVEMKLPKEAGFPVKIGFVVSPQKLRVSLSDLSLSLRNTRVTHYSWNGDLLAF